MSEIVLTGCHPTPLSSYLKALAVLRLVAEQVDPSARGFWRDDTFVLKSTLDRNSLVEFFTSSYAPTPIVSPWNGGSGFYDGDATDGIDAITTSEDPRFQAYKQAIEEVGGWPEMPKKFTTVADLTETLMQAATTSSGKKKSNLETQISALENGRLDCMDKLGEDTPPRCPLNLVESRMKKLKGNDKKLVNNWWKEIKKARTTCKQLGRGSGKKELLSICRSKLSEESLVWFDSAIAIRADGTPAYNPLLGSGGNEGRLDFSNNFMQRLTELLIHGKEDVAKDLIGTALFSETRTGLIGAKIGQFDPGRAGGYNQGAEVETKNFKINPWDYILTLEGASILTSSVGKKSLVEHRGYASTPFTVGFSGVGFSSSEHAEDGKAETWLPVWHNPVTFPEIRYLFSEGRGNVGRRAARNGLDFTRAVGSLGVDRGIEGFVRYAFLKRRGDSNVALPAGRLLVRFQPGLRLLDDLDLILGRLGGFLRSFSNIPAAFESARRRIDEATYECCVDPRAERFADLVCSLGQMESLIAQRDRSKKPALNSPLHGLRPHWVAECDDGGPEVRIAAALASIRATGKVGSIRSNLAGVDPSAPWKWAAGHGQQKWRGCNLVERLGNILQQRLMDAERFSAPSFPVEAGIRLSPNDLVPFLLGETDDERIEDLMWGFTLVDWWAKGREELKHLWREKMDTGPLPRGWCAMKLLHLPGGVRGRSIRLEPRIVSLLAAGRVREAVKIAHDRLRVSDLRPLPVEEDAWIESGRQLAGLLVPTRDQWLLESTVLEKTQPEEG